MRIVYNPCLLNWEVRIVMEFCEDVKYKSPWFHPDRLIHVPARKRTIRLTNGEYTSVHFPEFKFLILEDAHPKHWYYESKVALLPLFQISKKECIPFYLPNVNFWGCACLSNYLPEEHGSPIDYFWNSAFGQKLTMCPFPSMNSMLLTDIRHFDSANISKPNLHSYRHWQWGYHRERFRKNIDSRNILFKCHSPFRRSFFGDLIGNFRGLIS